MRKNNTAAHPSCLYRGDDRQRNVFVALSTCRDTISADLVINNTHHNVQFIQRERRDAEMMESGEDVNQAGKTVPADLPRVDFYHWVLVDIPASVTGLEEGAASQGVTPRGKSVGQTPHGITGKNDYTGWFAGDPDMEGVYGSYDGPCPPWNDSIIHRYYFRVFALDVDTLNLSGAFTGQDALEAMEGHVLGEAGHMGTYSMNPSVKS